MIRVRSEVVFVSREPTRRSYRGRSVWTRDAPSGSPPPRNVASYDRRAVDLSPAGVTDTPVCTRLSAGRRLPPLQPMLMLRLLCIVDQRRLAIIRAFSSMNYKWRRNEDVRLVVVRTAAPRDDVIPSRRPRRFRAVRSPYRRRHFAPTCSLMRRAAISRCLSIARRPVGYGDTARNTLLMTVRQCAD